VDRQQTGKSGETYFVGNHDFLSAVFRQEPSGAKPVVVSFKGNPVTVPGKAWSGRPWQGISGRADDFPADFNNYTIL
jgi:hypothetical protein